MEVKTISRKKEMIFPARKGSLLAVFLLLILLLNTLLPGRPLAAQVPQPVPSYYYASYLQHVLVQQNGSLKMKRIIDIQSVSEVKELKFVLPYKDGQSLTAESVSIAEVDAEGESYNAIGQSVSGELSAQDPIGSYHVTDDGKRLVVRMNAAIPKDSLRRLEIQYTVYQAAKRYKDAGDIKLQIFDDSEEVRTDKMGLAVSFEAGILPEEKEAFRLFQHSSLHQAGDLFKPLAMDEFAEKMGAPAAFLMQRKDVLYTGYAENIPAHTRLSFRMLLPSVWLSLMNYESPAVRDAASRIIREEENYRRVQIRRYSYRRLVQPASIVLLLLALVLFFLFHWYNLLAFYRPLRKNVSEAPEGLPPAVMSYLKEGKISGHLLLSVIYGLGAKGYLRLEDKKAFRVPERLLPDEKLLWRHEQIVLHWIWELCAGSDSMELADLEKRLEAASEKTADMAYRLRSCLDLYCAEHHYVPLPGEKKPRTNLLITGIIYIFLGILLSWLGNFLLPLLLTAVGLVFFITAFTFSKYTQEGYEVLAAIRAYERMLEDIDRAGLGPEEMLERLDSDFIAATALGVERSFLMNLRYVIPVGTLLESAFLRRFGFVRLQRVMSRYLERRGGMRARNIHGLYSYISRQVADEAAKLQLSLVRVRLKLFRDEEPEEGTAAP